MDLLIDAGNSRIKWAWSAAGDWQAGAADLEPGGAVAAAGVHWSAPPELPVRIVLCSVMGEERTGALTAWIAGRWPAAVVHRVRPKPAELGVINRYADPASLGADRWAALIGARATGPGARIVVDCGSAVTVDALSREGEFLGGAIFPGLRLLRAALRRGTAGVRVEAGEARDCLARNTADAVAAGTLFGLCGAIARVIEEQRRNLTGEATVLMTGGDAPTLAARLSFAVAHHPDLVLRGLARIAANLS